MRSPRNRNSTPTGPTPQAQPNTFTAYHDIEGPAKISTTIVHALADVMGVDVTDIGFSLYDSIDTDALDSLFTPEDERQLNGHICFFVEGFQVTVYGDGQIDIDTPSRHPT